MANKALVIDVKKDSRLTNGSLEIWNTIDNMESFTRDIETPKLDDNADKSAIVSGIPTVFARANMFTLALSYSGDSMSNLASSGMIKYYDDLVDEWLGLITCIALDSGKLQIKRIELDYSDGKPLIETSNIYEAKGAFGNLLFKRRSLWCEQTKDKGIKKPFINIIKYNDQVVGGTSPECLLFTAPSYRINPDPRYAPEGKFRDPIEHGNVGGKDWLALYAYVKNLIDNLTDIFTAYYQELDEDLRPNYGLIAKRLQIWLEKIRHKIEDDVEKAAANPVNGFSSPFSFIFNYSDEMYGSNGSINSRMVPGYTAFKAEDLLLPRNSEIARVILPSQAVENYSQLPVLILAARVKGGSEKDRAYFALPLSHIGLKIFGSSVSALIGQQNSSSGIPSKMTAEFDSMGTANNLTVYLTLNTEDGKTKNIVSVYTVKNDHVIQDVDILLWPNFISRQWNKYYMYSELPHGVTSIGLNAVPFVGEQRDGKFLPISDENGSPMYLTQNASELKKHGIDAKLLVTADHRVAENPYKYEIYQSNKPFSGIKLTSGIDKEGKEKESGFILIRYVGGAKNLMSDNNASFRPVNLGFDFGSTNSSVAYYDKTDDKHSTTKGAGLDFKNRRISLFGSDYASEKYQPRDFFFFSKKMVHSNALKSMLTLHDQSRMPLGGGSYRELPVAGGIPCFMSNLPIQSVTSNTISLVFDNCEATLINNMKWSESDDDKNYKKAYLRTVLLMVYAELFEKGARPEVLNWSYPSTMGWHLVNDYNGIWESLGEPSLIPILKEMDGPVYDLKIRKISEQNLDTGDDDSEPVFDSPTPSDGGDEMFGDNIFDSVGVSENHPKESGNSFMDEFGRQKEKKPVVVRRLDLRPKNLQNMELEFKEIKTDSPMTEACASANYSSQTFKVKQKLVYCFDVGGSTTDISVLYTMRNNKMRLPSTFMIKQNSIRFAAQRVSAATKYLHEDFKQVLTKVCNEYNIKLIGFNVGESRYEASTAPYYYEQIVDMLDINQLQFFYKKVREFCPRLFAVNMYVTGLIMYYAGQLARPLYEAVKAFMDENCPDLPKPNGFQPVFEGKGARVFEWLCVVNYPMAEKYYKSMFKAGAQLEMDSNYIDLSGLQNGCPNSNVKFEVSKGLASPNGQLQEPVKSFEIFGENGFKGHDTDNKTVYDYEYTTMITQEWMKEITGCIRQDDPNCTCFKKFLSVYYNAIAKILGLEMVKDEFGRGLENMNIGDYITQELPRFREAMARYLNDTNGKFDYVAPIIIIEGLKFYEKHLLKCFK